MLIQDDVSRVISINTAWKLNQRKKSTSMQQLVDNPQNYQISKLPFLTRNYNSVEKNIYAVSALNKSYSKLYDSPIKSFEALISPSNQNQQALGYCLIPSKKFTKHQNMTILDNLLKSFSTLRDSSVKNQDSYIQSRMKMKKQLQKLSKMDNSFVTSEQKCDKNENIEQLEEQTQNYDSDNNNTNHANNQKIINRKTCVKNGVKYPYKLFVMHNSRQQIIEQMMDQDKRKQNMNKYSHQKDNNFEKIKNINEEFLQNQVKQVQQQKQKIEFVSRGSMGNAYYALMALDKQSQCRVRKRYKDQLPQDSRFYQV